MKHISIHMNILQKLLIKLSKYESSKLLIAMQISNVICAHAVTITYLIGEVA